MTDGKPPRDTGPDREMERRILSEDYWGIMDEHSVLEIYSELP